MTVWRVHHAKGRFSKLLNSRKREGPQVVTWHGIKAAVLVPIEQWHRLQTSAKPTTTSCYWPRVAVLRSM